MSRPRSFRTRVSPASLGLALLAAMALGACTREEASDPALESDRSARAEADASERHPVAASQASGAGRYETGSGGSSQVAGRDPLDVLDPRQRDVPAPAEDASLAAQSAAASRSEAIARCATLSPRERSDCESYALSAAEDALEDEAEAGGEAAADDAPPDADDQR